MVEFIKTRNVKSPVRDVKENAGIDFYIPEKSSFTPEELEKFGDNISISDNEIIIGPHSDLKVPSGIKSKFPNNLALIATNKSGIATKKKLVCGACVIDASYQGEWHLHVINTSDTCQTVEFGQKLVQFIPHIISTDECVVRDINESEFFTAKTARGTGGFGSMGVK